MNLVSPFSTLFSGAHIQHNADDELLLCYEDFTDDELATLSLLSENLGETGDQDLLLAARFNRADLAWLSDSSFRTLEYTYSKQLKRNYTLQEIEDNSLIVKITSCMELRKKRDDKALAILGGRPLEMFSTQGNIAVTSLLDKILKLDQSNVALEEIIATYLDGKISISEYHPEILDTATREAIYADLMKNGASQAFLEGLKNYHSVF
jgi:hypothetical protein